MTRRDGKVRVTLDGQPLELNAGSSVASAAFEALRKSGFRRSVGGERRSALCGMGICFECRLVVDGQPHRRTCQLPVREGMTLETRRPDRSHAPSPAPVEPGEGEGRIYDRDPADLRGVFDVAVIGAGPAGIASAVTAGETGRRVVLIDDNPQAGGQIWRASRSGPDEAARPWLERLEALSPSFRPSLTRSSVTRLRGTAVIDASPPGQDRPARLLCRGPEGAVTVEASRLVLATGARELFLPFPGWTLPGVVGAGGLQALIKSGLDVTGQRIVVAGRGPLLLAVAALAKESGARIVQIAEQAAAADVARFALGLLRRPAKWRQTLSLALLVARIPAAHGVWPIAALADDRGGELAAVRLSDGRELACDLLACGFGLLPESGLARYLGAELGAFGERSAIRVDGEQQTSVAGVFAAGECTGVAGAPQALVEGRVAGLAAAGRGRDGRLLRALESHRRFASELARTFALRADLRRLPAPDTIACRCEDVRWQELTHYGGDEARRAKLETRCGMGPCQGRICGGALSFLLDFGPDHIRPPFFPTPLADLMTVSSVTGPSPEPSPDRSNAPGDGP